MPHAINYRLTHTEDARLACEVHIDGQLAVILAEDGGEYSVHAAPDFNSKTITAEALQNAIEGAQRKLEGAR